MSTLFIFNSIAALVVGAYSLKHLADLDLKMSPPWQLCTAWASQECGALCALGAAFYNTHPTLFMADALIVGGIALQWLYDRREKLSGKLSMFGRKQGS